jgi:hypothetical protein
METKGNDKKQQKRPWFFIIMDGGFLEKFVIKESKLLVLIFALIIVFISNRYACMKKLTEIEKRTTELKDVKYENLVISTELTTHSRQSQIEELLNDKGISLSSTKSSVYEIHK